MSERGECSLYDDVDLRFLLAAVLLTFHREKSTGEAEIHLKSCYQKVELWPGVGFYHGHMSSLGAVARLQDEPVGAFLLHHDLVDTAAVDGMQSSGQKLLLQVKVRDAPCKVSSLRIHQHEDDGVYRMKKLRNFSVHELIQQLPLAAGVCWSLGVRRRVYAKALEKKLSHHERVRVAHRALVLPWEQWAWRVATTGASRHNECWGTLCQLFAVRLEASDAHEMAVLVARDGLLVARDRALRADLFFTVGRVSFQLQRCVDAALAIKQAAIESARLPSPFNHNYKAITRAFSRVGGNQSFAFASQLERIGKLERMCVKAWAFDSCSPTLRGRPFCEALLLQRIDDEVSSESVADTFFLRALLRAHMRAFVTKGVCESTHVEHAFVCVRRLFERFVQVSTSHNDASGLHGCVYHISPSHGHEANQTKNQFSFHALLLTWHRMPFHVCFEMAEVFYRWPRMSCPTQIDVYESLYGRLRSDKLRNGVYAAYEELLLVRLAFLYAQRASDATSAATSAKTTTPVVLARKAVETMDELIGLRRMRNLVSSPKVSAKRIQWPVTPSLQFPCRFSLPELIFMRGFLWEHLSKLCRSSKAASRNAWRDFDGLHRELLALVVREQELEREMNDRQQKKREKLQGVRVFVGETMDVGVTDVLYSKPFVMVQCENQQRTTQSAATWMNQLSPGWSEYLEVDVASSKARLTVTVRNRSTRLRTRRHLAGDDQVLGSVQVYVEELLASSQQLRPQWYDLVCRDADGDLTRMGTRPRIRLAFQLTMQAVSMPEGTTSSKAPQLRRMRGNWDVGHLNLHLHGDLRRFVGSSWVWRWFAHHWLNDKDFGIAAWFLQRAIESNGEQQSVAHALDLVDLAQCYRATMGSSWLEYAHGMVDEALAILQTAYEASGSSDVALWKHLNTIWSVVGNGNDPQTPLVDELAKRIPASSLWIAMPRRLHSRAGEGEKKEGVIYYFNEDTCERFSGVISEPLVQAPLEWEDDTERVALLLTYRDPLQPRRVVVPTTAMRTRIAFHCQQQQELHENAPQQWVAVFNPRKQTMQFLSLTPEVASDDTAVVMTMRQPPTYAMLADEFLVFHVLVVQDAFRVYQQRRRRQRLLRGLLRSACAFACGRRAAETRLAQRAETKRTQQLNCLYVMIERATNLRAMDLFTSDPFVVVELLDGDVDVVAKGETSVKRNTLNPQWHEEFRLHYAFVDHELQTHRQQTPRLRLRVFDHDIVRTQERDDDEAKEAIDTEKQTQGEHEISKQKNKRKHDFLGLVETSIESLVHGRCVTADLELLDENGEIPNDNDDDSETVSRGTLTVTVQWTHDPDSDHKMLPPRRNAVKPMLLVRPRKRTRPKPTLTLASRDLVDAAIRARAELLAGMVDLGVQLDPLVRLYKRWRVAQAAGRTADEAKLMEQRLRAATKEPQPLYGTYAALVASARSAQAAVAAVLHGVDGPIRDWVESCETHEAETFTATLLGAGRAFRESRELLPSVSAWDGDGDVTLSFPVHVERVLALRETVVTWRRELLELLSTFFEPPVPAWGDAEAVMVVCEQFAQIRATLDTALTTGISRPPTANANASNTEQSTSTPSSFATTPVAGAGGTLKTNVAVAKRMERIERERRKVKKKQQ